MRVAVRVLGLLLVPAVRGGACKLDPRIVVARRWAHGREVAARAFLLWLAVHVRLAWLNTYMLWVVGALVDVGASGVCKLSVPDEILSAVKPAPVPVGPHDGTDEVGVALVRSAAGHDGTRRIAMSGSGHGHGDTKSKQRNEQLHGDIRGLGNRQIEMC